MIKESKKTKYKQGSWRSKNKRKPFVRLCWICQSPHHLAYDCPHKVKPNFQRSKTSTYKRINEDINHWDNDSQYSWHTNYDLEHWESYCANEGWDVYLKEERPDDENKQVPNTKEDEQDNINKHVTEVKCDEYMCPSEYKCEMVKNGEEKRSDNINEHATSIEENKQESIDEHVPEIENDEYMCPVEYKCKIIEIEEEKKSDDTYEYATNVEEEKQENIDNHVTEVEEESKMIDEIMTDVCVTDVEEKNTEEIKPTMTDVCVADVKEKLSLIHI